MVTGKLSEIAVGGDLLERNTVVGAVIVNQNSEILCALRSRNMSLGGLWEFPGGKLEPGESAMEALVREIKEELNCTIEVGAFITTGVHNTAGRVIHLETYFARIVEGAPTNREHETIRWLPVSKLPTLEWAPADVPTVNWLTQDLR